MVPVGKGKQMFFVHSTVELLQVEKETTKTISFHDFKAATLDGRLTKIEKPKT